MEQLGKFLHTHRRKATDSIVTKPKTHTKKFTPTACYSIPSRDVSEFMRLYCTAASRRNVILGITELPPENKITPLRIDFDFRLDPSKYSITKSPITQSIIEEIIKYYQIIIEDICHPDVEVTTAQI